MNVTVDDIKGIERELGIQLTHEQRDTVLRVYERVVVDRAGDWSQIIKELIGELC